MGQRAGGDHCLGEPARFQFTEAQWRRIEESLECADAKIWIRKDLERLARHFRTGFVQANYKQAKSENKEFLALAKGAKLLLPIFDRLSKTDSLHLLFVASPHLPEGQRSSQKDVECRIFEFRNELENLISAPETFGAAPGRVPANLDVDRNQTWEALLTLYEAQTGRRAAASESSNRGARRLPANGPFVRFLQAFTGAVPGEREPTGDAVRGWLRSFRRQYPQR